MRQSAARLTGAYSDGQSSQSLSAVLLVDATGARLDTGERQIIFALEDLAAESRIGNTPRVIRLNGSGRFVTRDHDQLDGLVTSGVVMGENKGWIHRLESHWHTVLLSIFGLILGASAAFVWGIPAVAKVAAMALPHDTTAAVSRLSLDAVEQILGGDSALDAERQDELRARFLESADTHAPGLPVQVEFRDGGLLGANALALPDGTIIFTDELVALAENDNELAGVFAHELGHVVHRHSLRQIIQGSIISIAAAVYFGDATAGASILAAAPVWLADMAYSRDLELEADDYAYEVMTSEGLAPHHFSSMLERLTAAHYNEVETETEKESGERKDYFSSHPATSERIARFEARERQK
ncbi:M48 family metallopeptidase [Allohahella marinimesophila]|uniref:M48 family metallopeptidase n=1 Tax=Allohahella marinimesophila TaxID=1054972 RepID=A0ABP7PC20_9GAMM